MNFSLLLRSSTLFGGVVLSSSLLAQTLIKDENGLVTGICALEVDGTTYNVRFESGSDGSYDSVFGSNTPTFLNNSAGALSAIEEIAGVLNSTNPPSSLSGFQDPHTEIRVPYELKELSDSCYAPDNSLDAVAYTYRQNFADPAGEWFDASPTCYNRATTSAQNQHVVFTQSPSVNGVTYDCSGKATGITSLSYGGLEFKVAFTDGTYNDLYAIKDPYFLGEEDSADGMADALQNLLNSETPTPRLNTAHYSDALSVPHTRVHPDYPENFIASRTGYNSTDDIWQRYGDITTSRDSLWNQHAVFTLLGPAAELFDADDCAQVAGTDAIHWRDAQGDYGFCEEIEYLDVTEELDGSFTLIGTGTEDKGCVLNFDYSFTIAEDKLSASGQDTISPHDMELVRTREQHCFVGLWTAADEVWVGHYSSSIFGITPVPPGVLWLITQGAEVDEE